MRFNLKKFFRCLGFSKVILTVILIQAVSSRNAHADGAVQPVFSDSTVLSVGGLTTISYSLLNTVSYSLSYREKYYQPVYNVILTITPTKGDAPGYDRFREVNTPLGGVTFVAGPGCNGVLGKAVKCVIPALGAGQTANSAVAFTLDPKIYSQDPFTSKNGYNRVQIEISYDYRFADGRQFTQPNRYTKDFPVILESPAEPSPVEIAPPPTPVEVVPPPVAPINPPITPDPNSGKMCGTVISDEACACLECQDEDIFDSKAELDKMFKLAATEANNSVAKFKKYESGKRNSVVVRSSNRRIKNLLEEFAELLKEMGDTNFICDSVKYCLDISNEEIISDIDYTLDEMKNVSIAIARKLRKLPNSAKDVREIRLAALSTFAEGLELLEDLPAVTSVCSKTDAAVVCGADG